MTELERQRMQEMIRRLNEASEAYYGGRDEIMSNFEWDALFDEHAKEAGLHIHVVHVLEVVEGRHWYRIEALRFHTERERERERRV